MTEPGFFDTVMFPGPPWPPAPDPDPRKDEHIVKPPAPAPKKGKYQPKHAGKPKIFGRRGLHESPTRFDIRRERREEKWWSVTDD